MAAACSGGDKIQTATVTTYLDKLQDCTIHMAPQLHKVAVIGAGVSGLLTARELQREGQQIVVYEKSNQIGGVWVYDPEVETDPLGLDPNRRIIHSSMYDSLRTNFPKQLMEFTDYSFTIEKNGKYLYFPDRKEVLKFLNDFARDFGLDHLIRFNTEVVSVEQKNGKWVLESKTSDVDQTNQKELFDAVVICNGHHTQPKLADTPGIKKWPGKQIHSHNYRVPEPYKDQVVVVIGHGPSGFDIAFDIAKVAKEVHVSSRFPQVEVRKLETYENIWQHSKIEYCHENGAVAFEDGALVAADIIIHCTGYKYDFPFLNTNGIVTVDDNRVGPLYKHVFPPRLAPTLSFVGIPKQTANFRVAELQAKWVARALSGKVTLPSREKMVADVEEHYRLMEETGVPKHHTHTFLSCNDTFIYLDWLAAQVRLPRTDEQLKRILDKLVELVRISRVGFRERLVESWPF
ncbi:flavin-containing monooxygenase FMO GS-OX5-like isoform X1 [Coffea arabica]|uniref:Flavin-containing monooxygenase n=1 Tax=Coffea arabica TaxID=13443 RepID=A0A6P6SYR4_COFAR